MSNLTSAVDSKVSHTLSCVHTVPSMIAGGAQAALRTSHVWTVPVGPHSSTVFVKVVVAVVVQVVRVVVTVNATVAVITNVARMKLGVDDGPLLVNVHEALVTEQVAETGVPVHVSGMTPHTLATVSDSKQ